MPSTMCCCANVQPAGVCREHMSGMLDEVFFTVNDGDIDWRFSSLLQLNFCLDMLRRNKHAS